MVVAGSSHRRMATFPEWDRVVLEDLRGRRLPGRASILRRRCARRAKLCRLRLPFRPIHVLGHSHVRLCAGIEALQTENEPLCGRVEREFPGRGIRAPKLGVAPAIAEFDYSCRDAVVEGSLLIALVRHADRVKVACQSLLVNVGGPIRTEAGGPATKSPIFGPIAAVFNRVRDRSVGAFRSAARTSRRRPMATSRRSTPRP